MRLSKFFIAPLLILPSLLLAQGAFGEVAFFGTYYTRLEDSLIGNVENTAPFFAISENDNSAYGIYAPFAETAQFRFGATYKRYFVLGTSTYFSAGVGYSNYKTTLNFLLDNQTASLVQQHYVSIPFHFHLLSNRVRKQDPFKKINAAHILQQYRGGFEVAFGAKMHMPILANRQVPSAINVDVAANTNAAMDALVTGFNSLAFEPELTFAVGVGGGVTFGLTVGYLLNPAYQTADFGVILNNGDAITILSENFSENNLHTTFGISFRGGGSKGFR